MLGSAEMSRSASAPNFAGAGFTNAHLLRCKDDCHVVVLVNIIIMNLFDESVATVIPVQALNWSMQAC